VRFCLGSQARAARALRAWDAEARADAGAARVSRRPGVRVGIPGRSIAIRVFTVHRRGPWAIAFDASGPGGAGLSASGRRRKRPFLHPRFGAAHVQVDLVITPRPLPVGPLRRAGGDPSRQPGGREGFSQGSKSRCQACRDGPRFLEGLRPPPSRCKRRRVVRVIMQTTINTRRTSGDRWQLHPSGLDTH